jgi:hypothetical protein
MIQDRKTKSFMSSVKTSMLLIRLVSIQGGYEIAYNPNICNTQDLHCKFLGGFKSTS